MSKKKFKKTQIIELHEETSSQELAQEALLVNEEMSEVAKGLQEIGSEMTEILTEAEQAIEEAEESETEGGLSMAAGLFDEDSGELEMSEEALESEEAVAGLIPQEDEEGFLPDAQEGVAVEVNLDEVVASTEIEASELSQYESAEIEEVEFVETERLESIIESILFASDRPVSLASIKEVFKGTNVKTEKIRKALDQLAVEYAGVARGVTLEEVQGGYQLRTKIDNMEFIKRGIKARQFRLSGPALEVLSIVAYKQPLIKSEVDEIRGVESGHLLRALMEKGLVNFEGKSDLPGKPMQYGTTRKFLEIFGLRNLKELPTLSQIDELLPEGIDADEAEQKPTLSMITDSMSEVVSVSYSTGEEELMKISDQLESIDTSSEFFEQEKLRQRMKRDQEKAQGLREALLMGESVSTRDSNWLKKYDEALNSGNLESLYKKEKPAFMNPTSQETPVAAEAGEETFAEQLAGLSEDEPQPLGASLASNMDDEDEDEATADENHPDDAFLNDYIENDPSESDDEVEGQA